jgi:Glycosyl transferases group 1
MMRALAQDHDVVLVHDPELVLASAGLGMKNLIWDVHEDPAAALQVKSWMPKSLRRPVATAWRRAERVAERQHHLLLAEHSYQGRFRRLHPVVTNSVSVPRRVVPAGDRRVTYLGSVTMSRGCQTMIEVGRELHRRTDGAVRLELTPRPGTHCKRRHKPVISAGSASCQVHWLESVALWPGLCLLRDLPNYRVSLPTKIVEYCALGVPVITTPLPLAADLIRSENVGFLVQWDDPSAVVDAILKLRAKPVLRHQSGSNGHIQLPSAEPVQDGPDFVPVEHPGQLGRGAVGELGEEF